MDFRKIEELTNKEIIKEYEDNIFLSAVNGPYYNCGCAVVRGGASEYSPFYFDTSYNRICMYSLRFGYGCFITTASSFAYCGCASPSPCRAVGLVDKLLGC